MSSTCKRVLLAVITAVMLATFVVGCGRGTVATVNGVKITRHEYYNRLEHLSIPDQNTGQSVDAGALVLQRLVEEELVLKLAEKKGVAPTEQQVNERVEARGKQRGFAEWLRAMDLTRDQFKEMMSIEQAAFNLQTKGVKVSDKEIRDFYAKNRDTQFTTPEYAEVAAIFTESKAATDKAMKLLDKGVDFATVALRLSSDRRSAELGGRLGRRVVRGDKRVPPDVQDLILGTPKGKYTRPIPGGDGGYVIFKIVDHRNRTTQKFGEVEYFIRQQLMRERGVKKNSNLNEELEKFRNTADVRIGIERYKEMLTPQKPERKTGQQKKNG